MASTKEITAQLNRWINLLTQANAFADEEGESIVRLARVESDELIRLLHEARAAANGPDPLSEALNSGDGTYRP